MRTYVDKNFGREYLEKLDLQRVGVYYNVPIKNVYEEMRNEFDYEDLENDYVLLDDYTIYNGDYLENTDGIEYEYTDNIEIEDYFKSLMNYKRYNHYLVVLFNSNWLGNSGYKIFDDYMSCFYRDYEDTMYVRGSSRGGKYLKLREYHHDVPMGHNTIIVGLTDKEYKKLGKMNIEQIIDYGTMCLGKVEDI